MSRPLVRDLEPRAVRVRLVDDALDVLADAELVAARDDVGGDRAHELVVLVDLVGPVVAGDARDLDAIGQETSLPFVHVHWWGICALSGTPGNHNIQIGRGEGALLLAPEFEAFATAFWLVLNMHVVEKSRAAAFANGAADSETIAAIVTAYCQEQATAGVGGTYKWAFGVVRETMAATRARLDEYLREVARVQGAV